MPTLFAIETSCDETAFAVVRSDAADTHHVLANVVHSQHDLHETYGGVVPELASRAQLDFLLPLARQALADAGISWIDIDGIAVGNRPGLIGSLLTGVHAAKALAWALNKPLLAVDHVQAHLAACWLEQATPPSLPALGLVVSGGHTALFDVTDPLNVSRIGSTIDDAIGEAYDKAAKMLEAGYPGGACMDKLARKGNPSKAGVKLPISMLKPESLDFSFSGLKTALLYAVRGKPTRKDGITHFPRDISDLSLPARADMAAAFQEAATEAIVRKVKRAFKLRGQPASLLVGGGVSANSALRGKLTKLGKATGVPIYLPDPAYCGDNAAMIASLALHRAAKGEADSLSTPAIPTTGI